MKRLEGYVKAFLEALGRVGQDCRADLQAVFADFRKDMGQLRADLRQDLKLLLEKCREMCIVLAAEVRLAVHRWIG